MSDIDYRTILPEGWARPKGFSHAVVARGSSQIRIAGQLGKLPGQAQVEPGLDFGTQWTRALANLVAVLRAAGGEPKHLVMLRAYVLSVADFNASGAAVGKAWMESLGKHFPAMTLVQVSGLIDPNATIEIEGEALLP